MRFLIGMLLVLAGCSEESETPTAAPAPGAEIPGAATITAPQTSALMAMPDNPDALKRLEAMGYTVHEDHLHAPGVTSCPKMGSDPVM